MRQHRLAVWCVLFLAGTVIAGEDKKIQGRMFTRTELQSIHKTVEMKYAVVGTNVVANPPLETLSGSILSALDTNVFVVLNLYADDGKTTVVLTTPPCDPPVHGERVKICLWNLGTVDGALLGHDYQRVWHYHLAYPTLAFTEFMQQLIRSDGRCFPEIAEYIKHKDAETAQRRRELREAKARREAADAAEYYEFYRMKDAKDFRRY